MRKIVVAALALSFAGGLGPVPGAQAKDAWLTTRRQAQHDLRTRFHNIARVGCAPDRSSATQVIGHDRYWQRFWCRGGTYDGIGFRLRYKSTGRCGECWTITNLTGTGPEPKPGSKGDRTVLRSVPVRLLPELVRPLRAPTVQ